MNCPQSTGNSARVKPFVAFGLAIWLGVAFLLGARGVFVRPPAVPPFPILIGAVFPLVAYIAAYLGWGAFRALILAADLRFVTAIQAWRAGGLGFLALYAHGVLPVLFAWPAGLGNSAIGITGPWVMLALVRRPTFAAGRQFVAWNLLGVLDLVVAVSAGALSSGFVSGPVGKVTTASMARLPLVLIPAYFVPLCVMLRLTALLQAWRQASSMDSGERV